MEPLTSYESKIDVALENYRANISAAYRTIQQLPPSAFPVTLCLISGKTCAVVWETTVEQLPDNALRASKVVTLVDTKHYPVSAEVVQANGATISIVPATVEQTLVEVDPRHAEMTLAERKEDLFKGWCAAWSATLHEKGAHPNQPREPALRRERFEEWWAREGITLCSNSA